MQKMDREMVAKLKQQQDPRILGNGNIFDNYPYSGAVKGLYNRIIKGEKVPTDWLEPTDKDFDLGNK